MMARVNPVWWWLALAIALVAMALARPVDHDESQYVASAVLTAAGLLPYRDYTYLQTPLQPFAFAPLAAIAGVWTWPLLRIVNALLGAIAVGAVYRAARAGRASPAAALAAAGLFASCDAFLFGVSTARNDALPCALLALALPLILRAADDRASRGSAMLAGLLLAGAAAAKVSYALPALAYGIGALIDRRHRPGWVALGALPVVAFVAWTAALAPDAFRFGVFDFPARAPGEYYRATGRAWKLGLAAKAIDFLKFLALGPALPAALLATRFHWRSGAKVLDAMLVAAVIAALLPSPTWRQYLLPILSLLFARLAVGWTVRPSATRGRLAVAIFAAAGVAPTLVALLGGAPGMPQALRQGQAIGVALNRLDAHGPIATLSPQYLPAAERLPAPRFATGPFYFRAHDLLTAADERRMHLVSAARLDPTDLPDAVVTGGEAIAPGGDPALDARLAAAAASYRRVRVGNFVVAVRR